MLLTLVVVLQSTLGLLALAATGLVLLNKQAVPPARFPPRRGWGVACLAAGGTILLAGSQYKQATMVQSRLSRGEFLVELQLSFQEPLHALLIQVCGPDPLQEDPETSSVRLRCLTRDGADFTREIPGKTLRLVNTDLQAGSRTYAAVWPPDSKNSPSQAAAAARLARVSDLSLLERVELELIAPSRDPLEWPSWIALAPNDCPHVEFFVGTRADSFLSGMRSLPVGPSRQAGKYVDHQSPAVRLRQVRDLMSGGSNQPGIPLVMSFMLGGLLVGVGGGLLLNQRGADTTEAGSV